MNACSRSLGWAMARRLEPSTALRVGVSAEGSENSGRDQTLTCLREPRAGGFMRGRRIGAPSKWRCEIVLVTGTRGAEILSSGLVRRSARCPEPSLSLLVGLVGSREMSGTLAGDSGWFGNRRETWLPTRNAVVSIALTFVYTRKDAPR